MPKRRTIDLLIRAQDGPLAAASAELRYVHDAGERGLRRRRRGRGFSYVDAAGRPVRDPAVLARIAALAIPPAWTDVWICATEDGHVQATGRDAKGRKQYRYHARFRAVRDEAKFAELAAFGRALPALRARVEADLGRADLVKDKVVATVVRIMELTCVRIGNAAYASANGHYGVTTLENRHARIEPGAVSFSFLGKSGVPHRTVVRDARLSAIVKRCRDLPGQRLFEWLDPEGGIHPLTSGDVNAYLREATGGPFTAKIIRTWTATVACAEHLAAHPPPVGPRAIRASALRAIAAVAAHLGNTPAVCRKSYVHPAVLDAHERGLLRKAVRSTRRRADDGLRPIEHALLSVLERTPTARGARAA